MPVCMRMGGHGALCQTPGPRQARGPSPNPRQDCNAAATAPVREWRDLLLHEEGQLAAWLLGAHGPSEALRLATEAGKEGVALACLRALPQPVGAAVGEAALQAAVRVQGRARLCGALLAAGACAADERGWDRLLRAAVVNQSLEAGRLLLQHGACAGAADSVCLCIAASLGDLPMVSLLLESGAQAGARGGWALKASELEGHAEVCSVLRMAMAGGG